MSRFSRETSSELLDSGTAIGQATSHTENTVGWRSDPLFSSKLLEESKGENPERGKRETPGMAKSRREAKGSNQMLVKEQSRMTGDHGPEEQTKTRADRLITYHWWHGRPAIFLPTVLTVFRGTLSVWWRVRSGRTGPRDWEHQANKKAIVFLFIWISLIN